MIAPAIFPLPVPEPASREVDVLARTIYGEARGEPLRGKEAVAAVVINRVKKAREKGGYWWGTTVEEVCLKPWQFSCWNKSDPNRPKILAVTAENRNFASCLRIARRAVHGCLDDPTYGSTHYHAKGINPPWARSRAPRTEIGHHLFYVGVE